MGPVVTRRARTAVAAGAATLVLTVAGWAELLYRSGRPRVDPAARAGWSVGPVTLRLPDRPGESPVVAAEITRTGDTIAATGFLLWASTDGVPVATVPSGVVSMMPTETREVVFPGAGQLVADEDPARLSFRVELGQ